MITSNPFADLVNVIPQSAMQAYIVLMFILVAGGTILDMIHKQSAKFFFANAEKAKLNAKREVSGGEKVSLAVSTLANEVLTSGEFSNPKRRISHLFTMYGFIIFVISTIVQIYASPLAANATPTATLWWHIGAAMLCLGGYWFWFFIRVDVSAEGRPWYKLVRADMFILSLLATATFALLWSFTRGSNTGWVFFALFILSSTILFGGVMWSKFAHMFFKPAAAFQKKITQADGSRENLPATYDLTDPKVQALFPDIPEYMGKNPENMGLGIKRESPNHY